MGVNKELKVYWFNPMRAATRSTRPIQSFLNFSDTSHFLPTKEYKDYYYISNFRNPYSRLVSIFYFIFGRQPKTISDFKLFAKKKIYEERERPYNINDYQINLTSLYETNEKQPDYLIKVENIYEDIKNLWFIKDNLNNELLRLLDENINNNRYYQETGPRPSWKEHYDDETAEVVYDFLMKDFELGGYDKNSWK
jgi:hypothetical protein